MTSPRLALFISLLLITTLVDAASVKSVSREQYRQDSPEKIYWEVNVTCSGIEEKRTIQQRADTDEWCARDVQDICARSKMIAAERVCSAAYRRAEAITSKQIAQPRVTSSSPVATRDIKPTNTAPPIITPPVTAPKAPVSAVISPSNVVSEKERTLANEIEIEEQRILIQQEKLDLRRRELVLKKRELELLDQDSN